MGVLQAISVILTLVNYKWIYKIPSLATSTLCAMSNFDQLHFTKIGSAIQYSVL